MPAQTNALDAEPPTAFDIRFGQIGLIQLQLRTTDPDSVLAQLMERMAAAPRFFSNMAVGLDLTALPHMPEVQELRAVLDALRSAALEFIGLISGADGVEELASELRLPLLGNLQGRPVAAPTLPPALPAALPGPALTRDSQVREQPMLHVRPVRSGQRIYAPNRDLVVLANVGSGAEVIADGCVHVYGVLRGRAVAGARGDTRARVFCQNFRAELISIGGVFRLFESLSEELEGKPVHAWLLKEELKVARIGDPPPPS